MQFLAENPFILGLLMCTCWPGIGWIVLAYLIGRRGLPVSIQYRGWKNDIDV